MKKLAVILLLCLVLVFSVEGSIGAADEGITYPVMHPDQETLEEWIEAYNTAPLAYIEMGRFQVPSPRGSQNLLGHLEYAPSERDQGLCGNCWAWAGTGVMEIALDVQEGIYDRLSVQYLNSCKSGDYACCGGSLEYLVDFYTGTGICIPWDNTKAYWQDGSKSCSAGASDVSCPSISTAPNYPISDIDDVSILTQTTSQATAIANIKNVLDQNRAVWFGFLLPNSSAWNDFKAFWASGSESDVYDMDQFCGIPYDPSPGEGGGHAVLCVGYNDEDPDNSYWIMLNSWGTRPLRPNGLFRIDIDMAYDGGNFPYYSFYWQTLDVTFAPQEIVAPTVTTNAATLVEETTATLRGTVTYDGGEACQYRFEYDTDSGEPYAYSTEWTGSKTTGQSFSEAISGLAKGTKYYFRAQAENSAGTASGTELAFLTKPDAPSSLGASTVSATEIDLTWTKGSGAQKTKIQRKEGSYPTDRNDGTQVYFGEGTSVSDTGLSPGMTYYYRAWSYVQGSEQWSDNYAQAWAATESTPNNPPQLSNSSVQPPSGNPSTSFYYYVNYSDSDGDSPSIKQVYIDGMPYTMSLQSGSASDGVYRYGPKNLTTGSHSYYFYFEDGKGGTARLPGLGSYSGPAVSQENNPPNTPSNPSPTNHATSVSINANLSWSGGDPDAGDTVTYDVYFGTNPTPPLVSIDQATTTYDPGILSYNTKYYWKIVARDNHGASTDGPVWDFTTSEFHADLNSDFEAGPREGNAPLEVTFDPTLTNGGIPPYVRAKWDFDNDGIIDEDVSGSWATPADIPTATYTYAAAGIYNPCLTVYDSSDPQLVSTECKPDHINVGGTTCEDEPSPELGFASLVAEGKLVIAYNFDPFTTVPTAVNGWTWFDPTLPPAQNNLNKLCKYTAYWVKVTQECWLTYGGNTYHLAAGWNNPAWLGC